MAFAIFARRLSNPKQAAEDGKSIFEHGGQNYVYMDYINAQYPKRELQAGELYDSLPKRPYRTDPLDTYHGMSHEAYRSAPERIQPDLHGELQLPAEHSFTAFQPERPSPPWKGSRTPPSVSPLLFISRTPQCCP